MLTLRSIATRRWSFWALLAAWVCANGPQSAVYEAVLWLKAAGTFSHQARLTRSVAALVTGREAPAEPSRLAAVPLKATSHAAPMVPSEAVLKKIDLGLPLVSDTSLRPAERVRWRYGDRRVPSSPASDVLLQPPQVG